MTGCTGRLRKLFGRRGKSLPPPGGTQSGTKSFILSQQQQQQKSLPDLTAPIQSSKQQQQQQKQENNKIIIVQKKSEPKSESNKPKSAEIEYAEDFDQDNDAEDGQENISNMDEMDDRLEEINETLIYPAPVSFRSKSSDEFEEDSNESIQILDNNNTQINTIIIKDEEFLEFNKNLDKELKSSSTMNSKYQRPIIKSPNPNSKKSSKSNKQNSYNNNNNYNKQNTIKFNEKSFDSTFTSQNTSLINKSFHNNNNAQSFYEHDISEVSHIKNQFLESNTIQKLFETYSVDKILLERLKSENEQLRSIIDINQKESLNKKVEAKYENDLMIDRLLAKETQNEAEKEALKKYFLSKQQETNESLINEQKKTIDILKLKCQNYEKELKKVSNFDNDISQVNFNELKDEINGLKNIIYHLNIELSVYQAKYSPPNINEKSEFSGLPKESSIPIWLVNSKYLSPLIAAYDERISEKDEKLKLLKKKIDDLTNKFKMILDENNQLHTKLEKQSYYYNSGGMIMNNNSDDLNELNKIRHHARLVLEENQALKDQLDLQQSTLLDIQKNQIQEVGTLSKRIIVNETDKTDLKNQIQGLKVNNDELLRKYNDAIADSQRKVTLQDFLNQTGELKRKIEEIKYFHKQELEGVSSVLNKLQEEHKELNIKYANIYNENKKLTAENIVLDQALNEGIGRKTQKKIQDLQKHLELAEIKEKTTINMLEKISKENEKHQLEKEAYQNLSKTYELEIKKYENKLADEDLKACKLEDKLNGYKDKSASKLANLMQQLKKKDSEFDLFKLESEKKISDILNLMQKKQDQLDEMLRDKRQLEAEVELVWQTTSNENQRLKESLIDFKSSKHNYNNSLYHKLLIDD